MREKILALADRLEIRAQSYEEPFKNGGEALSPGYYGSQSFCIASALREVSVQIRAELRAPKGDPE